MHDSTKRKKAEDALQKAHDELEQCVKERTVELTQAYEKVETEMAERARVEEQLRQAQKMRTAGNEVNLPEVYFDLPSQRKVFVHPAEPTIYFRNFKRLLKPDWRAAIIGHKRKGGFSFVTLFKHYILPQ